MKRSSSATPPSSDFELDGSPTPTTPSRKKTKASTPSKTIKKDRDSPCTSPKKKEGQKGMNPATKVGIAEEIIMAGLKNVDTAKLAEKYGLTKAQVSNHLTPGRSNIRSKLMSFAQQV